MKMLFFSSDVSEVESVAKAFDEAGIPCEVRKGVRGVRGCPHPREMELWIRNDKDCHRGLMLCVQLGVGFSKRPPTPDVMELEVSEAA